MDNKLLENLLDTILQNSFTQAQALRRLRALKSYLVQKLFTNNTSPSQAIATSEEVWIKSLPEQFFSQFKHDNVYTLVKQAEDKIKQITPLILVLPFELPEKELADIGNRLRQDYGKYFLMETKFDFTLIAGAALIWKGVYKDYSLHRKITEKKNEVLLMFKQTVHTKGAVSPVQQ